MQCPEKVPMISVDMFFQFISELETALHLEKYCRKLSQLTDIC